MFKVFNNLFLRIAFSLLLSSFTQQIFTAPGDLDTTFNSSGAQPGSKIFKIDPAEQNSSCVGLTLQEDGKIVLAGAAMIDGADRLALARLNPDGTFDEAFNGSGKKTVKIDPSELRSDGMKVAIQNDGKIVVFGNVQVTSGFETITKFALARFEVNGDLDTTFNATGIGGQPGTASIEIQNSTETKCYGGVIQNDGKIVLAGYARVDDIYQFAVARFNADGTLDEDGFNAEGTQKGVALLSIDNNNIDDQCYSITLDADEKIVVAGYTTTIIDSNSVKKFGVARLNHNGTLDEENFNAESLQKRGTASTTIDNNSENSCYAILIQSDGRIVLTGSTYDSVNEVNKFAAARFNSDGTLDENGFNSGGIQKGTVSTSIANMYSSAGYSGALQVNGKILVTGMSFSEEPGFQIARFNENGSLDTTFNPEGVLPGTVSVKIDASSQSNIVYASKIQADGNIVLAGYIYSDGIAQFAVARFIGDTILIDSDPTMPQASDLFTTRLIEKYGPLFA